MVLVEGRLRLVCAIYCVDLGVLVTLVRGDRSYYLLQGCNCSNYCWCCMVSALAVQGASEKDVSVAKRILIRAVSADAIDFHPLVADGVAPRSLIFRNMFAPKAGQKSLLMAVGCLVGWGCCLS